MLKGSIRTRLAISYGALAFFSALALGLVQLASLRNYYEGLEMESLRGSAISLGRSLANIETNEDTQYSVESTVLTFSYISNTRVRLISPEGKILLDSGPPAEQLGLPFSTNPPLALGGQQQGAESGDGTTNEPPSNGPLLPSSNANVQVSFPVSASLICEMETEDGATGCMVFARSSQSVLEPYNSPSGALLGYVELSEGPAFGAKILRDVTSAGIVAGAVAILLAASIGWFLSGSLTAPLSSLTRVTGRMAEGELSARADSSRSDEFGQLSQTFNKMATRIEKTVISLRQFVSDAAHEIFTPITALRTQLELARQEKENQGLLDQALTQVSRLEALTSNLLDLSKLEGNENTTEHKNIRLDQLVARLAEPFAAQAEQTGIGFLMAGTETPILIYGNDKQVEQLVSNLLSNAVKFTSAGGNVKVSLSKEDGFARIVVEDTGIGIPQEDVPYLFERFHRGLNVSQIAGSGLGLAISKAIVLKHSGKIEAVPRTKGASFIVHLPLPEKG